MSRAFNAHLPYSASLATLANSEPPDPCAELKAEVTRLRLLETMWLARVTWASVQGDGPTERANWEAYDKAREAYEAAGGAL